MAPRTSRSSAWLAAYLVCLVCVLSFIFFEVLDVDGSDFAPPLKQMETVKISESEHDVRRIVMLAEPLVLVVPMRAQILPPAPARVDRVVEGDATLRTTDRAHRFPPVLPRASLDAVPLA